MPSVTVSVNVPSGLPIAIAFFLLLLPLVQPAVLAAWVLLFVMMFAGALIRQFFVQRHGYHLGRAKNPWPFAAVGVVLILGVIVLLRPAPVAAPAASALCHRGAPCCPLRNGHAPGHGGR